LSVRYRVSRGGWWHPDEVVTALDGISFSVAPGEIVGVVGESGSGKSTLARAILQLERATAGSVRFEGVELQGLEERVLRVIRRRMQVIFQDPNASLNPRMTIGDNVAEGLLLQGMRSRAARQAAIARLLAQVGLASDAFAHYPHEFSGGQRQRVGIARALAVDPVLIVADEPVSALDVSVQAQILNLLLEQQEKRRLALLFIGHDLTVIRHVCDRVIVLYQGRIVEIGPTEAVLRAPRHPYTRALADAAPVTHPGRRRTHLAPLTDGGARRHRSGGCAYSERCPHVMPGCLSGLPPLRAFREHAVACVRDDIQTGA
jgi:oligopeptide/dipeptide ABC transporter ATP-binding protein